MIRVRCCGFPTSMKKCFENFSLVGLNSTFYQYPRERTVEGWRKKAHENFKFTVKAHQDISHKAKLKVEETSIQAFERMKQIYKTLNSRILLVQTPGSFGSDRDCAVLAGLPSRTYRSAEDLLNKIKAA